MTEFEKELRLEQEDAAEFLREVADALEDKEQLNLDFGDEKLVQPLTGKIPMRIFQDDKGLEIGFRLLSDNQ